jgi:hypothetical protein
MKPGSRTVYAQCVECSEIFQLNLSPFCWRDPLRAVNLICEFCLKELMEIEQLVF